MTVNTKLQGLIKDRILQSGGSIPFSEYMELALYHPEYGYYTSNLIKFGSKGDFTTAAEIGNLFAKCLAEEIIHIFQNIKNNNILEIGAGTGKLAVDLIGILNSQNIYIDTYFILEKSPNLRNIQQQKIAKLNVKGTKIIWLDQLPQDNAFSGVILANEVLDALAVTCFSVSTNLTTIQERRVAYAASTNSFYFVNAPASIELAATVIATGVQGNFIDFKPTDSLYTSEVNLSLAPFIQNIAKFLNVGVILFFDYGFLATEYYHATRNGGTLMCHYQHHAHTDPFVYLGLQDITAHVDFSAVQAIARENELSCLAMTTLAWFLVNCGITKFLAAYNCLCTAERIKIQAEINILTSPAEMGEIFKVLCLGKNYFGSLLGFVNGKSYLL